MESQPTGEVELLSQAAELSDSEISATDDLCKLRNLCKSEPTHERKVRSEPTYKEISERKEWIDLECKVPLLDTFRLFH